MGNFVKKLEENLSEQVEYEISDEVKSSERAFGVFLVIFNGISLIIFASHQSNSTGFYTGFFGLVEMIMLYGIMIDWIITASMEGIFRRKKLSRLFDLYGGMWFMAFALIWLLIVFPFDFKYFADIMPEAIKFSVSWISDLIARIILVLYIIFIIGGAIFSVILRIFVLRAKKKIEK